jgi:hypothetical protein
MSRLAASNRRLAYYEFAWIRTSASWCARQSGLSMGFSAYRRQFGVCSVPAGLLYGCSKLFGAVLNLRANANPSDVQHTPRWHFVACAQSHAR